MTKRQIYKLIKDRQWRVTRHGLIRDQSGLCPLEAAASVFTGQHVCNVWVATRLLGMTPESATLFIVAADNKGSCLSRPRRERGRMMRKLKVKNG